MRTGAHGLHREFQMAAIAERRYKRERMTDHVARDYPANIHNRGPARGSAYADGVLTLVCEVAYPADRLLDLTLQLPDRLLTLSGKTIGSQRRDDNRFDVRLRVSSLRREQRSALEQAFLDTRA
jgi:hypothetical protein